MLLYLGRPFCSSVCCCICIFRNFLINITRLHRNWIRESYILILRWLTLSFLTGTAPSNLNLNLKTCVIFNDVGFKQWSNFRKTYRLYMNVLPFIGSLTIRVWQWYSRTLFGSESLLSYLHNCRVLVTPTWSQRSISMSRSAWHSRFPVLRVQ